MRWCRDEFLSSYCLFWWPEYIPKVLVEVFTSLQNKLVLRLLGLCISTKACTHTHTVIFHGDIYPFSGLVKLSEYTLAVLLFSVLFTACKIQASKLNKQNDLISKTLHACLSDTSLILYFTDTLPYSLKQNSPDKQHFSCFSVLVVFLRLLHLKKLFLSDPSHNSFKMNRYHSEFKRHNCCFNCLQICMHTNKKK